MELVCVDISFFSLVCCELCVRFAKVLGSCPNQMITPSLHPRAGTRSKPGGKREENGGNPAAVNLDGW